MEQERVWCLYRVSKKLQVSTDDDIPVQKNSCYEFIKQIVQKEDSIYDKIINLCDLMCSTKLDFMEKRLMDLLIRHGVYKNTHYHLLEARKLKTQMDDLLGYNLYDLFPELRANI